MYNGFIAKFPYKILGGHKDKMAVKKNKEVFIINKKSGKALIPQGVENGALVVQTEFNESDNQIWCIEKYQSGSKIIHKQTGKVIDLFCGGNENGTSLHIWDSLDVETQLWKIPGGVSRKITNIHAEKVLDIKDMSDDEGAFAQIWEDVGGENQRWKLVSLEKEEKKSAKVSTVRKKCTPRKLIDKNPNK